MTSRVPLGTDMYSLREGRMKCCWTRTWLKVSDRLFFYRVALTLCKAGYLSPFYLKEYSKRIFRGALYNDSKFLSDINVMDYSLVVGVDNETHELVVGIVGRFIPPAELYSCFYHLKDTDVSLDYIRTYTWDKKLESWVKVTTSLGGSGKGEPTIVGPKQYRQRFISAMERYFPLVSFPCVIWSLDAMLNAVVSDPRPLDETEGHARRRPKQSG